MRHNMQLFLAQFRIKKESHLEPFLFYAAHLSKSKLRPLGHTMPANNSQHANVQS